ncbi:YihY/virulence factor BrkB family protein [Actinomadura alba]|uniref:YihY/virulence factor BrkB family protein n=1 Tax=Actinomadura alba TaxID=406431 RepID=A0ABR7LYF1_9ACTN|nr:YihY/virulence factor BrkB family protein [Actinomadura alba]MBC6469876.1 YihY/virulence factor BrkB family protein [Actinomadura alba]
MPSLGGGIGQRGRSPLSGEKPGRVRRWLRAAWRTTRRALIHSWADRILGLAAETAFWALLSLTPLLLVLVAAIGYLTPLFGPHIVVGVEARILDAAQHVLAPSAVDQVLRPTLGDVLRHGRGEIVSVGFLLALWTGSTAMSTYVNAIAITYGRRDVRSAVRARVLAFALYLGALVAGCIILPLLVTAPGWIIAVIPLEARPVIGPVIRLGYWPVLVVVCTALLATLYHLAVPGRVGWLRELPGAIVAMLLWLIGSAMLRIFLSFAITRSPTYGVLAAPAASLLFLYVTALAVLFGAELNAQIEHRRADRDA